MCSKIEEALIEQELHFPPKLFLTKDLADKEEREKVKEIAKRRNLTIVDTEDEATHLIHPAGDADGDVYCRPVFKKGEKCLVHFYRFPVRGQ